MRLAFPRVSYLENEDKTASITRLNESGNRDDGGLVYLFRCVIPAGRFELRSTVAVVTSVLAGQQLEESGSKISSLSVQEFREYVERYAEQFGNTFEVRIFGDTFQANDKDIEVLRDTYCRLLLALWSSYRYNNADNECDPSGTYPDTLFFRPFNLDRKFRMTLRVGGETSHG